MKLHKISMLGVLLLATSYNVQAVDTNAMMQERWSIESEQDKEDEYVEINVELTFYTELASCNGNDSKLTASGEKLNSSTIAVPRKKNSTKPVFPFGTKVDIEGYGERVVMDTGNPKYLKVKSDGTYIIDVFMPRLKGESDKEYRKRISDMGRVESTAKVYIN